MAPQFIPYQGQKRKTASDYSSEWAQGLNQIGNTFEEGKQRQFAQNRQQMLDKIMMQNQDRQQRLDQQNQVRQQREDDYKYGAPLDPNQMVAQTTGQVAQSSFMPGASKPLFGKQGPSMPGSAPVAQGSPLIEAFQKWRAGGMNPQQAQPEYYGALPQEDRSIFQKRQDPQYQAETDLKVAQAEKARREAMMPLGSDESYTIGGVDGKGNIIQVGNKSGNIRVIPVPGGSQLYPKNATDAQSNAAGYGDRAVSAHATIDQLFNGQVDPNSLGFAAQENKLTPNFMKSGNIQSLDQAKRNFLNAILRRESGAVISPSEFEEGAKQYFPQYGDTPETVKQKSANRAMQIQNLKRAAGPMSANTGGASGNNDPLGIR